MNLLLLMNMMIDVMKILTEVMRTILWFIAGFVLRIVDYIYGIILSFFGLQLSQFDWIWSIFYIVTAATGMFILFRIAVMLFRAFYNDESIQRVGGTELINRILSVGLILSLIPVLMPVLSSAAAGAATAFPDLLGQDILPSDVIIDSGMADFSKDMNTSIEIEREPDQHLINVINKDNINEEVTVDGETTYRYIPDTMNIASILLLGGFTAYCFVFVAVQVVQRMIGLMMKIVIAPYAVSGLIDPADNSTATWFRLCIADFLTAFFQMVMIWIAMLFATNLPDYFGGLAKGLAFIGAIFSIIVAPSGIAQIIGGDVGAQSGTMLMQQAQTFTQAAKAGVGIASAGVGIAAAGGMYAVGKAKTASAYGTYAAGRMLGGRTLNPAAAQESGDSAPVYASEHNGSSVSETPAVYSAGVPSGSGGVSPPNGNTGSVHESPRSPVPRSPGHAQPARNVPTVGRRGILEYPDGRYSRDNTIASRIGESPTMAGSMVSVLGRRMYSQAAERIFTTSYQQRLARQETAPAAVRTRQFVNDVQRLKSQNAAKRPAGHER